MDQQNLYKVYVDASFVRASTKEEAIEKVKEALLSGKVSIKIYESDEQLL